MARKGSNEKERKRRNGKGMRVSNERERGRNGK